MGGLNKKMVAFLKKTQEGDDVVLPEELEKIISDAADLETKRSELKKKLGIMKGYATLI